MAKLNQYIDYSTALAQVRADSNHFLIHFLHHVVESNESTVTAPAWADIENLLNQRLPLKERDWATEKNFERTFSG